MEISDEIFPIDVYAAIYKFSGCGSKFVNEGAGEEWVISILIYRYADTNRIIINLCKLWGCRQLIRLKHN